MGGGFLHLIPRHDETVSLGWTGGSEEYGSVASYGAKLLLDRALVRAFKRRGHQVTQTYASPDETNINQFWANWVTFSGTPGLKLQKKRK